jgi:hypothetical protein
MPSQAIMRYGTGIATKKFLRVFRAISQIHELLSGQYRLSFFQILGIVYVKKEMLRPGQVRNFQELDITCSDLRQQSPRRVFAGGD